MPQPASVAALAAELLRLYQQAWERIVAAEEKLLADWTGLRRTERLARLRELRTTVETLMDTADAQALRFTDTGVPQAYLLGAAASGVTVPAVWAQPDADAIAVIAADTFESLLAATTFVRDSTKTLIRSLSREHMAVKLITGQTAEQAGRELAKTLEGQRVAAVVYKDGSRHGLADYANVVARTTTATAYSTATLNSLDRAGIGYAECLDNPRCGLDGHDSPEKPNGRVYPLRVAQTYVISHPRCVRSWGGRPDVTTDGEAKQARGTATDEQNADQADVAVSRQEAAIARAFRRRSALLTDRGQRVTSPAHAAVLSRRAKRLAARRP